MPVPRRSVKGRSRRYQKKRWRPEYLPAALAIFTPYDPCKTFPRGDYHCVPASEITAEEVTGRKGGEQ